MTDWQPFETAPKTGVFLVWLAEEKLGSRIQVMRAGKAALIGGYFHFDAPKPLFWMPLPNPPEGEFWEPLPPETSR